MPKSTGEHWIGTPDLARELGVSLRTVYSLAHKGEFPVYKFGRVYRVKRADIEEFIDRSRVDPEAFRHLSHEAEARKTRRRNEDEI